MQSWWTDARTLGNISGVHWPRAAVYGLPNGKFCKPSLFLSGVMAWQEQFVLPDYKRMALLVAAPVWFSDGVLGRWVESIATRSGEGLSHRGPPPSNSAHEFQDSF